VRIALVIETMDTSRGGRETSTAQIASALVRRGHQVAILCRRGSWRGEGVEVVALGRRGLTRAGRLRNFVADVQRAIQDGRYDVVHAMLPVPGADVYQPRGGTVPAQLEASLRRRWLLGRWAVKLTEPLNRRRRAMADLERRVAADPRILCLAVSRMVAEELSRHYGRTDNVRVIFNAVDAPDPECPDRADWRQRLRFQLGVSQGDPVFLTVATNFGLKGVAEAIEAFASWYHSGNQRRNARLVVVGREEPEGYRRHAGLRDVGGQVVFVPPTPDVFPWYAAADACILLSWYDPCSRVVLEATRWGIPSITTAYNGAAEVLADGAGIIVESPRDRRAIVAAFEELTDPQRREARAEACRRVADRLSMDRHVEELLEAYEEVGRGGAARGSP